MSKKAVVQEFFGAVAEGDTTKAKSFLAPHIRWSIPGTHPLAGDKVGPDAILNYFAILEEARFGVEQLFIEENDGYVVEVHRGWSNRSDMENVDAIWAMLYEVEDGRITMARNLSSNQDATNAFFTRVFAR